jgi:hypothetical protein
MTICEGRGRAAGNPERGAGDHKVLEPCQPFTKQGAQCSADDSTPGFAP